MAGHLPARREGAAGRDPAGAVASPDTILAAPIDILFDFVAVHLAGSVRPELSDRHSVTSCSRIHRCASASAALSEPNSSGVAG